MANELRFDGKVAIITGAGNGLGRSHARLFASRGAKVVVNDLGGSHRGEGQSSAAADQVVAEIKAAGGQAVANYDSVEDGDQIIKTALSAFGRVDIVVNNAGILRDVSFKKMTQDDWDLIYKVHVLGAYRVTRAAWEHMVDQGYGRVIVTASAAGIYGNFGQANYATAKLGLVGFSSTLALEGARKNVHVNAIAPIAGSRMTETVLPKELLAQLKPEYVSPLVAWLCHEDCEENGGLFEVGGGFMGKLRWERAEGKFFKAAQGITPEAIKRAWKEVAGFERTTHPTDVSASMQPIVANLGKKSRGGSNEFIDVDEALAADLPEITNAYDQRDLSLYALGIGAAKNPLDAKELPFVYEMSSAGFLPLPTFAVIPSLKVIFQMATEGKRIPGLSYGFDRILHGEQYTEIKRPLPASARLKHKVRVKDIFDKGKHALVVTAIETRDADSGEVLAYNELTEFVRGAGGFGGERGPSSDVNVAPERKPDAVVEEKTDENQALLYRLSGDINPLHADPAFAKTFGFERPILHGLCTYGFAARAVVKAMCGGDPRTFKSIKARFADSVFPGETLITEIWKESGTRVLFRTKVKERDKVVISNAAVELYAEVPKPAAAHKDPAPQAQGAPALPTSADLFTAIGIYLEKNPTLAAKAQTIFQWKLSSPESVWVIDAKNGAGSCKPGTAASPDVTLELSDADFMAMATGKADPQKLYFGGKLKIAGNVMASMKMDFLKKIDPQLVLEVMQKRAGGTQAAAPATGPTVTATESLKGAPQTSPAEAKSTAIFLALKDRLTKNPNLWSEVKKTLQFDVKSPDKSWVVDGGVREGREPNAACTLRIDDADLVLLVKGQATARDLYQRGKLRVDGDVRIAHKLAFLNNLI